MAVDRKNIVDSRLLPARPDLAAAHLRGVVVAERYVAGHACLVRAHSVLLYRQPEADVLTEALHGEGVTVYEQAGLWSWGQLSTDGYVGWLESAALAEAASSNTATHRVRVLSTHIYPEPRVTSVPRLLISMNSRLRIAATESGWCEIAGGDGWVYADHLVPIAAYVRDHAAVAGCFRGIAYRWGGRSIRGIDCSGLVQIALAMTGVAAPRDSDMQEDALGETVARTALRRGDLVFWQGHVGIMSGPDMLLHANAHHMAVREEALCEAESRIAAIHGPITSCKRPVAMPEEDGDGRMGG